MAQPRTNERRIDDDAFASQRFAMESLLCAAPSAALREFAEKFDMPKGDCRPIAVLEAAGGPGDFGGLAAALGKDCARHPRAAVVRLVRMLASARVGESSRARDEFLAAYEVLGDIKPCLVFARFVFAPSELPEQLARSIDAASLRREAPGWAVDVWRLAAARSPDEAMDRSWRRLRNERSADWYDWRSILPMRAELALFVARTEAGTVWFAGDRFVATQSPDTPTLETCRGVGSEGIFGSVAEFFRRSILRLLVPERRRAIAAWLPSGMRDPVKRAVIAALRHPRVQRMLAFRRVHRGA